MPILLGVLTADRPGGRAAGRWLVGLGVGGGLGMPVLVGAWHIVKPACIRKL
jgi:hypothetical protein